jgi:diguanylate cyclase (GGDEF)-like protein
MNRNILLVDDDVATVELLADMLSDLGELRFASNGKDALRLAHEWVPDLILLDKEMPGMDGFEVCGAIKTDPELADASVIFVTSHSGPEFELAGFKLGAVDFIAKPVSEQLVRARVMNQLRARDLADQLRRNATIDSLTGVANRRGFDESLEREWRRARRSGNALALLMIDVDFFKSFNDLYGHLAGDACLKSLAAVLMCSSVRPADLVARYGGDEFAVLLPRTPRAGAEHVTRAVLDAVDALDIAHDKSPSIRCVTVSIGIASYDHGSKCWEPASRNRRAGNSQSTHCSAVDLLQAADRALYSAKHSGRGKAKLLDIADVEAPQLASDIGRLPS